MGDHAEITEGAGYAAGFVEMVFHVGRRRQAPPILSGRNCPGRNKVRDRLFSCRPIWRKLANLELLPSPARGIAVRAGKPSARTVWRPVGDRDPVFWGGNCAHAEAVARRRKIRLVDLPLLCPVS